MKKTLILSTNLIFSIGFCQIPTSGLNASWPFDGNSNDVSGNNNNGIVYNANLTYDRFGNPNHAYAFNGIDSYIEVNQSSFINIPNNQDFSISYWQKTNLANNNAIPISKVTYGSSNGFAFFAENTNAGYCNTSGQLSFYIAASAGGDACANTGICNDNTNWYNITGIFNHSLNAVYIYM